jgi:hypothetical protein
VGLLVTHASDLKATAKQLRWMLPELPRKVAIWVGGAAGPDVAIKDDAVLTVTEWSELDDAIATLTRRSV